MIRVLQSPRRVVSNLQALGCVWEGSQSFLDECFSQRLKKAVFYYCYSWSVLCLSRRPFLPADFSGAAVHFSISPFHHCGHSDVGEVGKEIWIAKGEKKIWLQEILYWSVWWVSCVWNLKPVFPPRPVDTGQWFSPVLHFIAVSICRLATEIFLSMSII